MLGFREADVTQTRFYQDILQIGRQQEETNIVPIN